MLMSWTHGQKKNYNNFSQIACLFAKPGLLDEQSLLKYVYLSSGSHQKPAGMQIPLFPLNLLPLPDELVPLHIFEPRYRQLLVDVETNDINFGIYCNHELNVLKLGGVMKLESIIKKYPTGESDIVVRCLDTFSLDKMYRTYKSKPYPGGDVNMWNSDLHEMGDVALYDLFLEFQTKRNITNHLTVFNLFQMAAELNLDLFDRYKFLSFSYEKKVQFIQSQLKFNLHLLTQEEKSKDLFHLN
jgi:uncharacterized protein